MVNGVCFYAVHLALFLVSREREFAVRKFVLSSETYTFAFRRQIKLLDILVLYKEWFFQGAYFHFWSWSKFWYHHRNIVKSPPPPPPLPLPQWHKTRQNRFNSFLINWSEIVSFSLCDVLCEMNMCTDSSWSLHALACSTDNLHVPICRWEEYYHGPVTHLTSVPTDPGFVTLIGNGALIHIRAT